LPFQFAFCYFTPLHPRLAFFFYAEAAAVSFGFEAKGNRGSDHPNELAVGRNSHCPYCARVCPINEDQPAHLRRLSSEKTM
jgi:hypothetical protein